MRTLTSCFQRAEKILEKFRKDLYFQGRLRGLHISCRVKYILKEYPSVKTMNNLEKNWFLYQLDEMVDLGICPFFKFSEYNQKQYCEPLYIEDDLPDLMLKMNNSGLSFSLKKLQCNCDLSKSCKKKQLLTR